MSSTSSCPSDEQLRRFALGLLPTAEVEWLGQHLGRCGQCLERLSGLHTEDELLEALARVRAAPLHSGNVLDELRRHLGELRSPVPDTTTRSGTVPVATPPPPPPHPFPLSPGGRGEANLLPLSPGGRGGRGEGPKTADLNDLLAPPEGPDEMGRLGPYTVIELLGAGGMGAVFRAWQQWPRRVVALKVLRAGAHAGREHRGRFRAEAEAVARLHHPGIVQVHEVGEREGLPYFTMEYVEGGSLAAKLAVAPLAPRAAAEMVESLARAVHHAHEHGVIHRDLKPSNVLLTAEGAVKVGDFGLAKQLEAFDGAAGVGQASCLPADGRQDACPTASGAILGTPGYMAPEQAEGQVVGPAADIYALGAILYECLTGRPPFRAATILETLEQARSCDPIPPGRLQPGVPRDLQTVCLKCLEKEPAKRYATAAELADDLRRFLTGEPTRARPVGLPGRLLKWGRRKPTGAALLGVSGLAVLALVLGALISSARLRQEVRRAEAGEERARRQEKRADAGYRGARDTLDRMLDRLARRQPGEVPQLKELERQLLEDALVFYQGVLDGADDPDPEVRLDTARAYHRAALIQVRLGSPETEFRKNFGRAITLMEGLPAAQRDQPTSQALLATTYGDRGIVSRNVTDLEKARGIYERLVAGQPEESGWRASLAVTEHQLGNIHVIASRWARAEPLLARAVALRNRLVHDHPRDEVYVKALAEDYVSLAVVYGNTGRKAEATAAEEKVETLLGPLIARHPEDVRTALALSAMNINWSRGLVAEGQLPAAVARASRAVELAEGALRREPALFMARYVTRNAHGACADAHECLHQWADALKDRDRVVELEEPRNLWLSRLFRAPTMARSGAHARAAAEAEALVKEPKLPVEGFYNLACVYALAAAAARSDSKLTPARRDELAARYAGRALALLRRLDARGYFNDANNLKALRTDADLNALRGRADFRQLPARGNAGKKPSP